MEKRRINTIGIRGSSGLVGSALSLDLQKHGFTVIPIERHFTADDIAKCDAIINLAGHTINCRWTKNNRQRIYRSRIETTERIASYINECGENGPQLLISASASGIYPSMPVNGDYPVYTEASPERGDNFLADVCRDWENAASGTHKSCRKAIIRLGVVISGKGGAYQKLSLPFKMGVAPVISGGKQPFPWIYIDDLTGAIIWIIENDKFSGVFNLVSPEKTNNRQITGILAKRYKSIIRLALPKFLFRILMGGSHILVTEGQFMEPDKLVSGGFQFKNSVFNEVVKRL